MGLLSGDLVQCRSHRGRRKERLRSSPVQSIIRVDQFGGGVRGLPKQVEGRASPGTVTFGDYNPVKSSFAYPWK